MTVDSIFDVRARYSQARLEELRRRLANLHELSAFTTLTIFSAGSYARLEASKYSDIDLFFLSSGTKGDIAEPRTKSLRLFGKLIDIIDEMDFPKFANDCEYLVVLHTPDILENLGSRTDDHENYFTARMLLLLESHCLWGDAVFNQVTTDIIQSYFKDYPGHRDNFQPLFLLNDITRYWKTLLLNYENKRNDRVGPEDTPVSEEQKIQQRVRNFKLKYSRMTTCFATIAALGSHRAPVTEAQVLEMTKLTPQQRLLSISTRVPAAAEAVREVLDQYARFLEMTGLPTADLESHFADGAKRRDMFHRATGYGDSMYNLVRVIDEADPELRLLRTLVI
jgi:predicted nucleotidyltransferase